MLFFPKFIALLILVSSSAKAATIVPLGLSALEFGGDKIAQVTHPNGSKSSIAAGQGILVGGGLLAKFHERSSGLELQNTLSMKWISTNTSDANVTFSRWPIELLAVYNDVPTSLRIGGGITYQIWNRIKGSKTASAQSADLENALGFIFLAEYSLNGGDEGVWSFGIRYTAIDYKNENVASSINGNSIGFNLTYFL
jgi:hypothetical protein